MGLLCAKWQLCSLDEILGEYWMLVAMYQDPRAYTRLYLLVFIVAGTAQPRSRHELRFRWIALFGECWDMGESFSTQVPSKLDREMGGVLAR